jgi:hypothetical protein
MGSPVKKFLATLLFACFALTLNIGCSGDSKDKKSSSSSSSGSKSEEKKGGEGK